MDNDRHGIRVTGHYATFRGLEYFAHRVREHIWLFTDDDPLPTGFERSQLDWISGEVYVPLADIESLDEIHTTCEWRGHPFTVGIIVGDLANVYYAGKDFGGVSGLPGMIRPDKYEVQGMVPVDELTKVEECVERVALRDDT